MSVEQACEAADAECGLVSDGCDGQVNCNELLEQSMCPAYQNCILNRCQGCERVDEDPFDGSPLCSGIANNPGALGFGYRCAGSGISMPPTTESDGVGCQNAIGGPSSLSIPDHWCCDANVNHCVVYPYADETCPDPDPSPTLTDTTGKPHLYDCVGGPSIDPSPPSHVPSPECVRVSNGGQLYCCSSTGIE